jgi:hypothetical protein
LSALEGAVAVKTDAEILVRRANLATAQWVGSKLAQYVVSLSVSLIHAHDALPPMFAGRPTADLAVNAAVALHAAWSFAVSGGIDLLCPHHVLESTPRTWEAKLERAQQESIWMLRAHADLDAAHANGPEPLGRQQFDAGMIKLLPHYLTAVWTQPSVVVW